MSDPPDYPEIVPKNSSEARGIDFCGTDDVYYIIRSDMGVYMRCEDFHEAKSMAIFSLSEACRWGDHYLAFHYHHETFFYIIKGNTYRRVTNMNGDLDAVVFNLHANCQGGSSYYSTSDCFYVVFTERGVYRRVKNLNSDAGAVEFKISEAFLDGIYFWATTEKIYCLKQADKWSVTYHRSINMNSDQEPANFSVHEKVLNFLPGGLADTKGKAFGLWQLVKSFQNESDIPVDWERTVKKTVGFTRSKMSSIEHNWSIELGAQYESGTLIEMICKFQFNLTAQYGGASVNTDTQDWSETTEESETLKLHVEPKVSVYIWQYQMGFGDEKNLFSPNLMITNDPNAPVDPPLAVKTVPYFQVK